MAEPSKVSSQEPTTDEQLLARFPGHGVTRDSAAHYRGRLAGRLIVNRCTDCGRFHQPPRPMCPRCWSWNIEPTEMSGRGTIHLLMHLHMGPPADGVDYGDGGHPVVVVELDEQEHLRITGTVQDFPAGTLRIGAEVELGWVDRNGGPTPAFRPRSS